MALQEELEVQGNFFFRYRGMLPIFILLLGVAAYVVHVEHLMLRQPFTNLYNYCCLAITIFGLLIRIYAVGHSPTNTSGRNTNGQLADELNTTGIYSIVRHPLYVGNFFMWLGVGLLSQNSWFIVAFVFMYWVYYERIMFAEEQYLRNKFGFPYVSWAQKTPAFIPNFSRFIKPATLFNARKAIRQEKTGIMLIFVVYFIFDEVNRNIVADKMGLKNRQVFPAGF